MPSKTRSVTREATNLITATPDHIAIKIAASLDSAVDLFHLSLAHRRLSLKKVAAPESESDEHPSPDQPAAETPAQEKWSIANEGARQWVLARPLIQQAWLPPRENECWMERMNTVSLLAANPTFAHCDHLSLEISARHDVRGPFLGAVVSKNDRVDDEMFRTAKSGVVMGTVSTTHSSTQIMPCVSGEKWATLSSALFVPIGNQQLCSKKHVKTIKTAFIAPTVMGAAIRTGCLGREWSAVLNRRTNTSAYCWTSPWAA